MASFDPSVIDVEHFLDTIEVRNMSKATMNEMRFSCPLPSHPGEDNDPSCYMNIHTTAFFCHGCKGRGNAVSFTSEVLGISPLEATRMLRQAYSRGGLDPDARSMTEEMRKVFEKRTEMVFQPQLDDSVLDRYAVDWPDAYMEWVNTKSEESWAYMLNRGFEPEWLDDWDFGFDQRTGRITIPVRDEKGVLVGFKARATDGRHPKYLVLGDMADENRYGFKRYFPSRVVFGAYRWKDSSVPRVIVHEGELNAVACYEKTGMPSVAINGSHFSDHHAKIIRRIADEAVLFLDEDSAGQDCVWGWTDSKGEFHKGIVDHLVAHMPIRIIEKHTQDAADLPAEEINRLVEESRTGLQIFLGMS